MKYDVFISYRRDHGSDKAIALKEHLEQWGRRVYMDTYADEGGKLDKKIHDALSKSRNLIVVISSADSFVKKQDGKDWFFEEMNLAHEQKKNIVPVYYDITYKDLHNRRKTDSIDASEKEIITKILDQQSVQFHEDNPGGSFHQINKRLKNSYLWRIKNDIHFLTVLLVFLGIVISLITFPFQCKENNNLCASNNKLDNINKEIEELRNTINEPYIIFVGGGSVKKYLYNKGIDIKTRPNSFYVNLPSGTTCDLLEEEVIKQKRNTPFTFIFLSAEAINHVEFQDRVLKEINKDVKNCPIQIAEIELGEDTLVVYKYPKSNDNKQTINVKTLHELLKDSVNEIWTTKDESGTLNKYKVLLKGKDDKSILDTVHRNTFFDEEREISSNVDITKPNVYLGSQNYKPTLKEIDSLAVIADSPKNIKKLYLYILAFKDNGKFKIDDAAYKFLKEINQKDSFSINAETLNTLNTPWTSMISTSLFVKCSH